MKLRKVTFNSTNVDEKWEKFKSENSQPKDGKELKKIVDEAIKLKGNNVDLNWIDTGKVTDMSDLFRFTKFDGDISKWDVSNVKAMSLMFMNSKFNGDISNWDVSNVETMRSMFLDSEFKGDISKWDVSRVKNMALMFAGSNFNGDLSKWNVSKVEDMRGIFNGSSLEKNPPKWYKGKSKNSRLINSKETSFQVSHVVDDSDIVARYTIKGGVLVKVEVKLEGQDNSHYKKINDFRLGEAIKVEDLDKIDEREVKKALKLNSIKSRRRSINDDSGEIEPNLSVYYVKELTKVRDNGFGIKSLKFRSLAEAKSYVRRVDAKDGSGKKPLFIAIGGSESDLVSKLNKKMEELGITDEMIVKVESNSRFK